MYAPQIIKTQFHKLNESKCGFKLVYARSYFNQLEGDLNKNALKICTLEVWVKTEHERDLSGGESFKHWLVWTTISTLCQLIQVDVSINIHPQNLC